MFLLNRAKESIWPHRKAGFTIIGLLIALLIITFLALFQMRSFQPGLFDAGVGTLRKSLLADLAPFVHERTSAPVVAANESLTLPDATYVVQDKQLLRQGADGDTVIVSRVIKAQFRYFAEKRPLEPPLDLAHLQSWSRIKLTLWRHNEEEDPNWPINNGVAGIDLDGDPNNGNAKVQPYKLEVTLPEP